MRDGGQGRAGSRRIGRREIVAMALLALFAAAIPGGAWTSRPAWTSDGLFYQAHVLDLRGQSASQALESAWSAPSVRGLRAAQAQRDTGHPLHASLRYSAKNYERRWTVPLAGAAVYPLFHERSLQIISLLGYVAIGPALLLLLLARFRLSTSFAVSAVMLLAPPVREWSFHPLTDSWGVALESVALLAALLTLERGRRWLGLWLPVVVALAFTRDSMLVLATACLAVAVRERTRISAALTGSAAVLAVLPALIFGGAVNQALAYDFNGYRIPPSTSWSYVAPRYPHALVELVHRDALYVRNGGVLTVVLFAAFAAGVIALLVGRAGGDRYFTLIRGALLGAVLTMLVSVNYTSLRLELIFVPPLAVGLACAVEWATSRLGFAPIGAASRSA